MAETTTLFFQSGSSDKFYRATLDGPVVTFTWGRRGTNGQTQTHDIGLWAARHLYEEKIAEKRAKGYREAINTVDGGTEIAFYVVSESLRANRQRNRNQALQAQAERWDSSRANAREQPAPITQPASINSVPEPEEPAGWPRGIRHIKPNTERK